MDQRIKNMVPEDVKLVEVIIQGKAEKNHMPRVFSQNAFDDKRQVGDVADGRVFNDKRDVVQMEFAVQGIGVKDKSDAGKDNKFHPEGDLQHRF